jgi:acetyl-CoA acetyltransferase
MSGAVILDAVRTPIGCYGGVLSTVRPDDLAAHVVRAAVRRNGLDPGGVDELYMGNANGAGETTATWPAWQACWPACRSKCRQ